MEIGATEKRLLEAAIEVMKNAYVLRGYTVGAAVLGEDGEIYEGCNVESVVSGLGTCAERSAIDHAVLHGNRRIKEVAMVMDVDKQGESRVCGACLQYIHDFARNATIKIVTAKTLRGKVLFDTVEIKRLKELFPFPYKSENCRKP
jgi:cytidine deaminase